MTAVPTAPWPAGSTREIAHDFPGPVASATVLAGDASYIYVATSGQILRIANMTHGDENTFAQTDGTAKAIVVESGTVYWIESAKIRSLPADKPGEKPTDLATAQNVPRRIAVHGDAIYWTTSGDNSVWRASKHDGTGRLALASTETEPVGIAVDDDGAVYWTNHGDGRVRVVRPR